MLRTAFCGVCAAIALATSVGCTPKVQVEAPKEPITINMNIKIEHEIRVKVDKDLDQLLEKDKELF
jgi:YnbE-like lipoprotein